MNRSAARSGVVGSVITVAAAVALAGCGGPNGGGAASGSGAGSNGAGASSPAAHQGGTDRAFLTGMVAHHAAAVAMSQVELARGSNPQVKAIAQTIISDQQREIGEMTQLAQEQYQFPPSTARNKPMGQLMGLPISMDMAQMGPMMARVPQSQTITHF